MIYDGIGTMAGGPHNNVQTEWAAGEIRPRYITHSVTNLCSSDCQLSHMWLVNQWKYNAFPRGASFSLNILGPRISSTVPRGDSIVTSPIIRSNQVLPMRPVTFKINVSLLLIDSSLMMLFNCNQWPTLDGAIDRTNRRKPNNSGRKRVTVCYGNSCRQSLFMAILYFS